MSVNPETPPQSGQLPPQAQRVYDTVIDYHDTIQAAYGEDITEQGKEADAWYAAHDIAEAVEQNPDAPLTETQSDLLAAVEAHSASLKAGGLFTAEQNAAFNNLTSVDAAGFAVDMARERRARWDASTDETERAGIQREMRDLREYSDMLVSDEAAVGVADIDTAVDAYNGDPTVVAKARIDTRANVFFSRYGQEIAAKAAPETAPEPVETPAAEDTTARKEQATEDARKSVEAAREQEVLAEVLRISRGHSYLYADYTNGLTDMSDRASVDYNPGASFYRVEELFRADHKDIVDWRGGLSESVIFADVVSRQKQEKVFQKVIPGRFGRATMGEETRLVEVPGTETPKLVINQSTGQQEPAISFAYRFKYDSKANKAEYDGELPRYREYQGGRQGRTLEAAVELPKSVADQLQVIVRQNPQAIRDLTERLFLENNSAGMTEQQWRQGARTDGMGNPVRPPYEALPSDWAMAIVKTQQTNKGDVLSYDKNVEHIQVRR